jgi:hypothetical protein
MPISLYLITYNCARLLHPPSSLSPHLFSALSPLSSEPPSLVVISLQEIAPLAASFLGGSQLTSYYATFTSAVRTATRSAFNEDYALIAYNNVGLTAIMVFARKPTLIKSVTYAAVGLGFLSMGNKGAVGVRLTHNLPSDPSKTVTLTFVSAHLAPHEHNISARNANWESLVKNLVFADPAGDEQSVYSPSSYLFLLGDLNYRTSSSRPGELDYLVYPQPQDRINDNTHYLQLFLQDQLSIERMAGRAFQGLEEEKITFPPTYKYIISRQENEGEYWGWSKSRWPSWTDRILYLPADGVVVRNYTSIPQIRGSDHQVVAMHAEVPEAPVEVELVAPWGIQEGWRGRRATARKLEVIVGVLAWLLGGTGRGVLFALLVGAAGGWWVVRAWVQGYRRLE